MACWKAHVELLLSVIELLFLSLAVKALQVKMCQNSLPSGVGRSLGAKISGEVVVPGEYFLVSTKLDTFCYPTVQTAPCYVPSFWHNTGVWQTDRQTDGTAVANTALAMRALRRAVIKLLIYLVFTNTKTIDWTDIFTALMLTTTAFSMMSSIIHCFKSTNLSQLSQICNYI